MLDVVTSSYNNIDDYSYKVVALGKGGPLCRLNEGPLLYTPLYHDLSAHAIKLNNAFHK